MTVYVVQKQMRFDNESGELVPKFPNLDKAERWGKMAYLLSPTASPFSPEGIIAQLKDNLKDFGDDDFLLLVGNPVLIGIATAIAAGANNGRVKFLQWSGRQRDYTEIAADLG